MNPRPVLLDTSFLITYADDSRSNHSIAREYFREAIRLGIPLFVPTLVVAEFERRQQLSDLGLNNFRILPFNFDDAQEAAKLAELLSPSGLDRLCLAADIKIIAQAKRIAARVVLTEDASTLGKYLDQLRSLGFIDCYPLLLKDGLDISRLSDPTAPGLSFPVNTLDDSA